MQQLVLVVVTWKQFGKSAQWAAQLRQNTYANELLPHTPFFLIALPDHFYLWKEVAEEGEVLPTYDMDPRFFLNTFFKHSGLSLETLNRESFDLLITGAFSAITFFSNPDELGSTFPNWLQSPQQEWLFESGLFEAIKGGYLHTKYSLPGYDHLL